MYLYRRIFSHDSPLRQWTRSSFWLRYLVFNGTPRRSNEYRKKTRRHSLAEILGERVLGSGRLNPALPSTIVDHFAAVEL